MHLKLKVNKRNSLKSGQKSSNRKSQNMASSLVNDDEDSASSTTTRNTQQQNNNSSDNSNSDILNQLNNNSTGNSTANPTKMHGNEAKLKKENLQQRKQELEKLLNEKSWLLQQLQKKEAQILNGTFEYANFNDFISTLAVQYKQEQGMETGSSTGGISQFSANEEAILRRKPLAAKENHQQQHHNALHRRQSEISNRSSEYDNFPHHDTLSTHSDGATSSGGRGGITGGSMTMHQAQQAQQQYNAKSALKKRSATVAGTTQQSAGNLQMLRQQQHHLEQQQLQQQMQQQHFVYKQHHYHHPQQHLFKQHVEHHQVLMPHLQYATQKFYYTTLQPTQSQNTQQQQQYGRYIKAQPQQKTQSSLQQQQQQQLQQQQQIHIPQHAQQQSPTHSQHHVLYTTQMPSHQQHQQLLLTPPHSSSAAASSAVMHMDNISLYSLNSNNVATLHRQAQQQQPIIVQCDKYYLSPTTHHVAHGDGGGFIKSSQNIKEYISPMNSPQQQQLMIARERKMTSQTNLSNRGATITPSIDAISLAPSYVSMETVDYMTTSSTSQPHPPNLRWRSQTNLPPPPTTAMAEMKSHSSDMLNNNQYYNTAMNAPPTAAVHPPPNVTQVKPFKPLDEISINSYTSETQKKSKSKQWMESSLDGPVIRQTQHGDNNDNAQQRPKLSSQSLNTSRHYSMSAAQAKPLNSCANNNGPNTKLSQSTSYLNQMEALPATSSISQAYNVESSSPQNTPQAYKYIQSVSNKPPARLPLYINAGPSGGPHQTAAISPSGGALSIATSPAMVAVANSSALSPDIRIESPKNMTVVQPATFQPYKEVTKPFEMSDFYKYSTKYRQKENNNVTALDN